MAPILAPLVYRAGAATGCTATVVAVENGYFGETVTTAGLLGGDDIVAALRSAGPFDTALLPAESLNDDGRFIDDVPLERLALELDPLTVHPAHELAAAFASL
jgi:NifB/MoaA-like Fe-S oxidoreductase